MKPTVYIETTIPSYYCDNRPELRGDIARTREWWDDERSGYECFVSPVVLDELSSGSDAPSPETGGGFIVNADSPIVEEVRKRRSAISARFDHDLKAYARHLREIEQKNRDRHPVVSQVTVVAEEDKE